MIEVFLVVSVLVNVLLSVIVNKSWKQNEKLNNDNDGNLHVLSIVRRKYEDICKKAYVREGRAFVKYIR